MEFIGRNFFKGGMLGWIHVEMPTSGAWKWGLSITALGNVWVSPFEVPGKHTTTCPESSRDQQKDQEMYVLYRDVRCIQQGSPKS